MSEIENITADPAEVTAAVQKFSLQLRAVRRRAGDPSLRDMVYRVDNEPAKSGLKPVSVSTLGRALVGKKFPKWWVVEGLLVACRADDTTREKVQSAWYVIAEMITPIGFDVDGDHINEDPVPGRHPGSPELRVVGRADDALEHRRNTS
ncbi:MAG: hypothetical protein ABIZ05_14960 [Pseudonocardiaceae bacterium]